MKTLLKYSLFIAALSALSFEAISQEEQSRNFSESWNDITEVVADHRHGTLEVIPHSGGEVKLVANITIHAKEESDARILINHFEIKSNTIGNKLEIETKFNTKQWTTSNNNTRIKFSDGTKVTGIKKIEIKYQLHVPALEKLTLSNKYNDIIVTDNLSGDLTIKQYDATLKVKNVDGDMDLSLKYGKAEIGTVGDLKMDIYDSKAEISSAQDVIIKSKYSGCKLGTIFSAKMDSYDGYCKIESVTGELHIKDKYSTYEVGSAGNAFVTMYDAKMQLGKVSNYSGISKYSLYDFKEVGTIELESNHDDHFNIQSLGVLDCEDSKYSSFEIESLLEKAILNSSYDDDLIVAGVRASFNHFEIDCKYTTVKLPLTEVPGYEINATMKYGKLSYAEPTDHIVHKEYNEQLELKAKVGNTNSDAKVIINGYDSNIRLN